MIKSHYCRCCEFTGFASQALEARFETETLARRCSRFWLEGLIAIPLFDLFLFADYLGTAQHFRELIGD